MRSPLGHHDDMRMQEEKEHDNRYSSFLIDKLPLHHTVAAPSDVARRHSESEIGSPVSTDLRSISCRKDKACIQVSL